MLVRQDKISVPDVKLALGTFSKLDADGSGELDRDDVLLFLQKDRAQQAAAAAADVADQGQ